MKQKKPTHRFDALEPTICRDLRVIIIKLQTTSLRVNYDLLGSDPAVCIWFDRNGKRCVSECRQPPEGLRLWPHFLDNLRAGQLNLGGDLDEFKRLRAAYESALKGREK